MASEEKIKNVITRLQTVFKIDGVPLNQKAFSAFQKNFQWCYKVGLSDIDDNDLEDCVKKMLKERTYRTFPLPADFKKYL